MDLPDCPPGAEGYQDSVVEIAKKPGDETTCTKAETEFQEHLNSLKIRLENGETRCMVERRGRDISGKWIYLCYPCGSVCSGESILQTHISGKKHKIKLAMRSKWPMSIFDDHPFNQNQKATVSTATEKVLQKMAAAVEIHKKKPSELEEKYNKYREATCHIQEELDKLKAPLVGVEYLVEHPPEQAHYEPCYVCTLCTKQGHPRTIINHLTCFWHRYNYLLRHFPKACLRLGAYKNSTKYREGVNIILNRLTQRVADTFGRLKPVNIDKEEFEKDKDQILQWIFKGHHFSEKSGVTFEEVVDAGLIKSLVKSEENKCAPLVVKKKDPSPPVVAAPSKPHYNARAGRRERRMSMESLSDISDDDVKRAATKAPESAAERAYNRDRLEPKPDRYHEEYAEQRREIEAFRSRYTREVKEKEEKPPPKGREPYKVKLAEEKRQAACEAAAQMLTYHEKNPEKHPLYPEEWKKFWNRRYKEIQAEGKEDPSKHDFKPEWIVFWTKRMKELHEEELQTQISEIYRRMNLPAPELAREEPRQDKRYGGRRSPDRQDRRRSPVWSARVRSPESRRRSSETWRRSPEPRRKSPRRDHRPVKRFIPDPRYTIDHRGGPEARPSPPKRTRSRSRSPVSRHRSPSRTHITLESVRRSRSPLSRRDPALRNRSPQPHRAPERDVAPSLQTVMISDEELKPDDDLSPWNSDNDMDSISSMSRSGRAPSHASSRTRYPARHHDAPDHGPPENVVATLRVLVALEDYLGSLGPKIVDLLTDALKMEKDCANSSEELLERESAVVLIETAKEKLKGAAQAGLVSAAAAPAVRAAVLRAAATLHEADTRTRNKQAAKKKSSAAANNKREAVPVAGVGEVDRAQIAQQMAAALIAQGKTDVTSEELSQLVEAVVGMAEAKKREAEAGKKAEARPAEPARAPPVRPPLAKLTGTATALQMLQSAYDENDKKTEKEDAPDAMDGLSDSDLETLLKNFNELSAEEQHSLIAYLKKLEAREPQRVERLRQYVSAAATPAPPAPPAPEDPPAPDKKNEIKLVTIESDDDDYTVEEVFQSATQKVKEDQIRKELDLVKKSLEETKDDEPEPLPVIKPSDPIAELTKQMSSASDLFALVQASIKSTSTAPAVSAQGMDVVTSGMQPRSFGDVPEKPIELLPNPPISPSIPVSVSPLAATNIQDLIHQPQNQSSNLFPAAASPMIVDMQNSNQPDNQSNSNYVDDETESYNQALQWDNNQIERDETADDRVSPKRDQTGAGMQEQGQNQFGSAPNLGSNELAQGPPGRQFGPNSGPNQFGQGNNVGFDKGPNSGFGQGLNSGFGAGQNTGFGQGPNFGPNQYGQGFNSGPNQFGQGPGQYQYGQGPNKFGQGQNHFGPNPGSDWQGHQGPKQPWHGSNHYPQNSDTRDNFMNGGRMDFMNQQHGLNNNFRGRGGPRGRGRGRGRF